MPRDFNDVRYEIDTPENFSEVVNSPWYSDAEYPGFSPREYDRRHAAAREAMTREGLHALILTGSPNNYSLGGAVTWASGLIDSRAMCQYMVLPLSGDPTLFYAHGGCHAEAVRRMVCVDDVRGVPDGYGNAIADRLGELGISAGRVGIVTADRNGPEYMGLLAYQDLTARLPGVEFVFLPGLLHELTYRKGPEELDAMRRAGALTVNALEAMAQAARPGRREYQLAAAATGAILDGGGKVHLAMVATTAMDDPRVMFPNPNPSARVLTDGDIVLNEISAMHLGYSAKIAHPITLGAPTAAFKELYAVIVDVVRALEGKLRAGVDLRDLQTVAGRFRAAGLQSRPMVLHGIDMITAGPKIFVDKVSATAFDGVLSPGMVMNVEATPVSADGAYGLFLSRSYAITDGEPECLTPYPLDDFIVL